jgi:hypothetical protein
LKLLREPDEEVKGKRDARFDAASLPKTLLTADIMLPATLAFNNPLQFYNKVLEPNRFLIIIPLIHTYYACSTRAPALIIPNFRNLLEYKC